MSSPGSSFSIDLERAPQAVRELEEARDELLEIMNEAVRLGSVDPGSRDSVSRDAATLIGRAAVGGPRSLVAAVKAGVDQIQGLIDSMNADIQSQRQTESDNAGSFRS